MAHQLVEVDAVLLVAQGVERALADLKAGLDKANTDLDEGREQAKAELKKSA